MKLTFLCSKCRSWFKQNQEEIPERCDATYRWAASQFESGDIESALHSIGTVFEMSELMIKADHFCRSFSSDWLVASSKALIKVLNEMGQFNDSNYIRHKTQKLLNEAKNRAEMTSFESKLSNMVTDITKSESYLRVVH